MCVSVWVCTYECRCFQRPEEGARAPRAGVTRGCEPSNTGSRPRDRGSG